MDTNTDKRPRLAPKPVPAHALRWQWSRLPALSPTALYAVLAARQQVFAVEQQCAYLDADGLDHHAWHLLGWDASSEPRQLAAYLRLIDPGCKHAEPAIGRVLTLPSHRGAGLGRALMREGIERCGTLHPGHCIRIAAQQRLQCFYASLGFIVFSRPYLEDGIPHVDMRLEAPLPAAAAVDSPRPLR